MLNWLKGKKESHKEEVVDQPFYSRLRAVPSRGLPSDLGQKEQGEAFKERRDLLKRELLETGRRPPDDVALFTELLAANRSIASILHPGGGGPSLLVFSTPFRAIDYFQSLLATGPQVQYVSSSPAQLLAMLRDLGQSGVNSFTLDRCPRCSIWTSFSSNSMKGVADVVTAWAIIKATNLARGELYFAHALHAARANRLEEAREVALECVGHVSLEDPNPHLLLGQVAVELGDQVLLQEARAFLRFFHWTAWDRKLDGVARSGSADFTGPEGSFIWAEG